METGGGRVETGNGREKTGDRRVETGDGRKETGPIQLRRQKQAPKVGNSSQRSNMAAPSVNILPKARFQCHYVSLTDCTERLPPVDVSLCCCLPLLTAAFPLHSQPNASSLCHY